MSAVVATSHRLATRAGAAVLREGGNAVDAAVCAAAVLGVVEPQASGLGGDCFAIVVPGGDMAAAVAYDGAGRAAAAADAATLRARGVTQIDPASADAVTVPGAVEAWDRLTRDHGRLGVARLLAPAIDAAREGFEVHPAVAAAWSRGRGRLSGDPVTREAMLPGGAAPPAGALFAQPRLGATLERIARDGAAGFYTGPVAEDLVARLQELGGPQTAAAFAATRGEYVELVAGGYRDAVVWECPPSAQGVVALQVLALLERFEAHEWDPLGPERHHVLAEVTRLALADRDRALADRDVAPGAADALLDDEHVAALHRSIDLEAAGSWAGPTTGPRHTTYVCAVDAEQTVVSLISSIFHPFGSGLTGPRSGVLLHCRGAGFVLDADHPNRLAGGRRPLHTIIPAVAELSDGRLLALGVTGGDYQPTGHAYVLGNLVDHGLGLQPAVDLPRAQPTPDALRVEPGLPGATAGELRRRGHRVVPAAEPIGSAQLATLDRRTGAVDAAADRRRDGCVLRA